MDEIVKQKNVLHCICNHSLGLVIRYTHKPITGYFWLFSHFLLHKTVCFTDITCTRRWMRPINLQKYIYFHLPIARAKSKSFMHLENMRTDTTNVPVTTQTRTSLHSFRISNHHLTLKMTSARETSINYHQQSFLGLISPERSNSNCTYWCQPDSISHTFIGCHRSKTFF